MYNKKQKSEKGKLKFSEYFKQLNVGDKVALVRDPAVNQISFHKRMQGRTGEVVGKRGNGYVVKVKDINMEKTFILLPIHLKRIGIKKVTKVSKKTGEEKKK